MTVAVSVPSQSYQAGPRTFGPTNIPLGATKIQVTFTRESWPLTGADVVLRCAIECSTDGGVTYPYGSIGEWTGGTRIDRLGNVVTSVMLARGDIPEPTNANRKVRAAVNVLSALQTAVAVETF